MNKVFLFLFIIVLSILPFINSGCSISVSNDSTDTSDSSYSSQSSDSSLSLETSDSLQSSDSSSLSTVEIDTIFYSTGYDAGYPALSGVLVKWKSNLASVSGFRIYYSQGDNVDVNSDYVDVSSEYDYYIFTSSELIADNNYSFAVCGNIATGFSDISKIVTYYVPSIN